MRSIRLLFTFACIAAASWSFAIASAQDDALAGSPEEQALQDDVEEDQEGDHDLTLAAYIEEYPDCLSQDVVYEGCTLMFNSDGENLFVQFNILHPELQMRILMQGVTFYVDPTGKKKKRYALTFPAASSVEEVMMSLGAQQPDPDQADGQIPDIKPLVSVLSGCGASFEISGKQQQYDKSLSNIGVDEETHCLSYSFLLPVEPLLADKKLSETWRIGLFSEGGRPAGGGPGMGGPGMGGPGMGGPGMGGPGNFGSPNGTMPGQMTQRPGNEQEQKNKKGSDLRKIMMNDIVAWTSMNFSEACSIEN